MNTIVLMMFGAFLCVVSAFPRTPILQDPPVPELYLTPQGQIIKLLPYALPMDLNTLEPEEEMMPVDVAIEDPEEEMNGKYSTGELLEEEPTFVVRSRRSTQPGAPNVPQGGSGGSAGNDRGGVDVMVSRGEGGSRRVEATGEGNVWRSKDGRGSVDVHGHYSRDFGGRYGTGRPQYGGGIRYRHRF